jgi:tRNASer (uridine44-2'-O)-methyltransferase
MPSRRNDPRGWSPIKLAPPYSERKAQGKLHSPWQYVFSNAATYPPEVFAHVALQLIFHPERNSKNIRRADILSDSDVNPDVPSCVRETIDGMVCTRTIIRRLMPRNPNLDPELEQTCSLYVMEGDLHPTLITYHCHYVKDVGVPYYVPDVLGIAFELCENNVYIAYLPLPEKPDIDDRLQRVALNLLRTIHRHWCPLF